MCRDKKKLILGFNKEDMEKISGVYPDLVQISDLPHRRYQIVQKKAELKDIETRLKNISSDSELKKIWEKDRRRLKREITKLDD